MTKLLIIPILIVLLLIQTVIISNLPLINGTADLLLLVILSLSMREHSNSVWWLAGLGGLLMDFISAVPFGTYLISYLVIVGLARLLQNRVWQTPILSLLFMTVIGTFISNIFSFGALLLSGIALPWYDSLTQVMLPGLLLNLLLVLPVYLIVSDLANWIFPVKDMA
jgi:rod shape-determining protein MreD